MSRPLSPSHIRMRRYLQACAPLPCFFCAAGCSPYKIAGDQLMKFGEKDGVRLGHVIWTMTALLSGGDMVNTRKALRDFVAAGKRFHQNGKYRILDVTSGEVMLAISDRMWSEAVGYRTPVRANIDDLLSP